MPQNGKARQRVIEYIREVKEPKLLDLPPGWVVYKGEDCSAGKATKRKKEKLVEVLTEVRLGNTSKGNGYLKVSR